MDKVIAYIKDENGDLMPVATMYDADGNEITAYYAKKTDIEGIEQTANEAKTSAEEAATTANEASQTASEASETASAASETASAAQKTADANSASITGIVEGEIEVGFAKTAESAQEAQATAGTLTFTEEGDVSTPFDGSDDVKIDLAKYATKDEIPDTDNLAKLDESNTFTSAMQTIDLGENSSDWAEFRVTKKVSGTTRALRIGVAEGGNVGLVDMNHNCWIMRKSTDEDILFGSNNDYTGNIFFAPGKKAYIGASASEEREIITRGDLATEDTAGLMSAEDKKNLDKLVLPSTLDPVLDNNSWEKISEASQAGIAADVWSIGDTKAVKLSGTMGTITLDETLYVYILGFDHNSSLEGSNTIHFGTFKTAQTDGVSVCLIDGGYNSAYSSGVHYFNVNHWGSSSSPYNTNYGGWAACDMRYDILGSTDNAPSPYGETKTTDAKGAEPSSACATSPLPGTLLSCFPDELRAVMRPMTKYTDNVGNSSNADANISATKDYLPLLAAFEIFAAQSYANQYEQNYQAQYEYYANGNAKTKYRHTATGTTAYWWERSPYYGNANIFCAVYTNGNAYSTNTRISYGVAPAFCV